MIKYVELLYSTTLLLKNKFGYDLSIKDNEKEVKEPTFFVKVTPLTTESYLRYSEKLVNIAITYTNEVVTQEDLLDMQNQLDELFDMYLKVGERKLTFKKKFSANKDLLTLTLTLDYLDSKTNIPDADKYTKLMEELIYRDGDK